MVLIYYHARQPVRTRGLHLLLRAPAAIGIFQYQASIHVVRHGLRGRTGDVVWWGGRNEHLPAGAMAPQKQCAVQPRGVNTSCMVSASIGSRKQQNWRNHVSFRACRLAWEVKILTPRRYH